MPNEDRPFVFDTTPPTDVPSESPTPEWELSHDERDHLYKLAAELTANPADQPDEFVEQSHRASRTLPDEAIRRLRRFARFGSHSGAMLIRGVAVGRTPSTPPSNNVHAGEGTAFARQLAILTAPLGEMVAYEAEGKGRLFQDIVPAKDYANRQVSLSSRVELEAHTEQAHSPFRPDHLLLGCLRGDPNASTFAWTARDIVNTLTLPELELAREPLWTTRVDESFRLAGANFKLGDVRGPMPILFGDTRDPFMVIDHDLMSGTSKAADALLKKIVNRFKDNRRCFTLTPGDILVIDNRRAMHGRSIFYPRYDAGDRFVVRCFTVQDLGRLREARPDGSRTVASTFS